MSDKFESSNNHFGKDESSVSRSSYLQLRQDDCVVKVEELILKAFGFEIDYNDFLKEAETRDLYFPGQGGTSLNNIGKLLESRGLSISREKNGNIFSLTDHISRGQKVIVGVKNSNDEFHTLLVTGVNTKLCPPPDRVEVLIQDPETGIESQSVPMDEFIGSWSQADCVMISTNMPPPSSVFLEEMIEFDYEAGHIESIGNLDYNTFNEDILPRVDNLETRSVEAWQKLNDSFYDLVKNEGSLSDFIDTVEDIKEEIYYSNNNEEEEGSKVTSEYEDDEREEEIEDDIEDVNDFVYEDPDDD